MDKRNCKHTDKIDVKLFDFCECFVTFTFSVLEKIA